MSIKLIIVFILSFSLALTENLPENQVLESEQPENTLISDNTQISEKSETSKNTQTSENDVSDSAENKLKLSDLLFEYLEIGKNFKNTERDDSESEKPLVFVDPRKMHKKFYEKLFQCFKQEEKASKEIKENKGEATKENKEKEEEATKENSENDDVEIKGLETSQDCKEIETETKEKVVEEKPIDEPLENEPIKDEPLEDEPLVEEALKVDAELKSLDTEAV